MVESSSSASEIWLIGGFGAALRGHNVLPICYAKIL
jgi:hypothetical protein